MKKRRVTLWIAVGCACFVIAVAGVALRRRNTPRLPPEANYGNLPALFSAALKDARDRAISGGFAPDDIRALAHLYQANRLNDQALACYGLLRSTPGGLSARDHYYLAEIAQYQGDLDRAEAELSAVVNDAPDYLPAQLALGEVLFKSGRADEATKRYNTILATTPNQPQAMFGLARIELQNGNDDAAIARLGTLVTRHPETTSAAGLLAQVFDRRGETARANAMRQWSRQKPEPLPEDPWMDALLGDCYDVQRLALKFEEYFASGQMALAVPLLKRVEELDPASPIPQLLRGWTEARDHNDQAAVKEYRAALDKGGDPEKICPYLAQAYVAQGRVDEAASLMAEFYAKKPDSIPILIAYSEIALKQGDKPKARALLSKVVEHEPYLVSANMGLASILWESGDRDEAAKCLERVAQVSASDVPSRALLGEYHLGKQEPALAIPPLEQALPLAAAGSPAERSLAGMLFAAYIGAGGALEQSGNPADAVSKYYDKAIHLAPDNPNGYAREAAAWARLSEFDKAAEALRQLQKLQPSNPTVCLSLGDVLYQVGQRDEARAEWQKALTLASADNPGLRDAIGQRLNGPITDDTFR
jgi:predicted Zn-dependent protease